MDHGSESIGKLVDIIGGNYVRGKLTMGFLISFWPASRSIYKIVVSPPSRNLETPVDVLLPSTATINGRRRSGNHVYKQRCRPETRTPSDENGAKLCWEGEVASKEACKGKNVACAGGREDQATSSMWQSPVIPGETTIEYIACLFSMVVYKTQLLLPILS